MNATSDGESKCPPRVGAPSAPWLVSKGLGTIRNCLVPSFSTYREDSRFCPVGKLSTGATGRPRRLLASSAGATVGGRLLLGPTVGEGRLSHRLGNYRLADLSSRLARGSVLAERSLPVATGPMMDNTANITVLERYNRLSLRTTLPLGNLSYPGLPEGAFRALSPTSLQWCRDQDCCGEEKSFLSSSSTTNGSFIGYTGMSIVSSLLSCLMVVHTDGEGDNKPSDGTNQASPAHESADDGTTVDSPAGHLI